MSAIENPRLLTRRTMLTGLTAAVSASSAIVTPVLAAAPPDPVLPLLVAEQAAWDRAIASIYAQDSYRLGTPERAAADQENSAAWAAQGEALRQLTATVPTTPAGALAMIDRFKRTTADCTINSDEDGLTNLLASLSIFISGRA